MQDIWIKDDEPISVSFDTKGYRLFKGCRGILGSPSEAFLCLVMVKEDKKILLQRTSELKGHVLIRTKEEALGFVRLFTSLNTHYLFSDSNYIEPSSSDDDNAGIGVYSKIYEKKMKLNPVRTQVEGSNYVIERNLADQTGKLIRVTERVGSDGSYRIEHEELIDANSPVIYPVYE